MKQNESKAKMLGELLTIAIVLIAYAFYKLSTNRAQYFKERNLKYKNLKFKDLFAKTDVFEMTENMYNAFPEET